MSRHRTSRQLRGIQTCLSQQLLCGCRLSASVRSIQLQRKHLMSSIRHRMPVVLTTQAMLNCGGFETCACNILHSSSCSSGMFVAIRCSGAMRVAASSRHSAQAEKPYCSCAQQPWSAAVFCRRHIIRTFLGARRSFRFAAAWCRLL
jgi:hypothetical protein